MVTDRGVTAMKKGSALKIALLLILWSVSVAAGSEIARDIAPVDWTFVENTNVPIYFVHSRKCAGTSILEMARLEQKAADADRLGDPSAPMMTKKDLLAVCMCSACSSIAMNQVFRIT